MTKNHSKLYAIFIGALFVLVSSPLNGGFSINDDNPPVTIPCYDQSSGKVTLFAFIFPIGDDRTIEATYYILNDGDTQVFKEPIQLPQGTTTIEFWSVDNFGNIEDSKYATYTYDTTPPTLEFTEPSGGIYIFGNKIIDFGRSFCIGKVLISVKADDGPGVGVQCVLFSYGNDTGFDDDGNDGWTDTYKGVHFGKLTITARAMDKKGLLSEPVSKTITVCSLGFL